MLSAGFDGENLIELAGQYEPFNQFQLQDLTIKVLIDLNLDYSDQDQTIKNYARYLIDKSLDGELDSFRVLAILKTICIELDYLNYLYDFYLLYFAKADLVDYGNQSYWYYATTSDIDKIILEYFVKWKSDYLQIR